MDYIQEIYNIAYEGRHLGMYKYENDQWFNRPAKIGEVRKFESDYNITIPEPLVRYLTELGDGGIGPDAGIYSLREMRRRNVVDNKELEPMIDHSLTDEKWRIFAEKYIALWDRVDEAEAQGLDEEADSLVEQTELMEAVACAGGIFISTPGCTMETILMCRGDATGEVFVIDFDYQFHHIIKPWYGGKFEDWMINGMREELEKPYLRRK